VLIFIVIYKDILRNIIYKNREISEILIYFRLSPIHMQVLFACVGGTARVMRWGEVSRVSLRSQFTATIPTD